MVEVWTVKKILDWTTQHFSEKDIPEPRLSAELLLADVLGCTRIDLYLQFERIVSIAERQQFRAYITRRLHREPVAYILGHTEFMGLPFRVNREVLIPRPETELLVEAVIEHVKSRKLKSTTILDIGTGSGCIAVAIKKNCPECQVWAVEKSPAALELARENARLNAVEIEFLEGDFFSVYEALNRRFAVLVSNPPYVSEAELEHLEPEVKNYEPRLALVSGADALSFYRKLAPIAPTLLEAGGRVFFETAYNQARQVLALFQKHGFSGEVKLDYNQTERVVILNYEKAKEQRQ